MRTFFTGGFLPCGPGLHSTAEPGTPGGISPPSARRVIPSLVPDRRRDARSTMHVDAVATNMRSGTFEPSGHQVQFFKNDAFIVATVAGFVSDALARERG